MQMDEIEVFVEVVEARSFTKAAERLRMPPATVSAKIARLEERLGVTLIQRTTRKLNVTRHGEAYYAHCARAVGAMREAHQELTASASEPSGHLRITAPFDLAHSILLPIVERFLARHLRASIEMIVTNRKLDLLAESVDIAVRAGSLTDSRLIARKLASVHLTLWASEAYASRYGLPQKPEDLIRHAFIGFGRQITQTPRLRSGKRSIVLPAEPRIRSDDLATVRKLVGRGNGIGLLPAGMASEDGLLPVLPDYKTPAGTISLVYPSQRFVPPLVRAFIDCATESGER